MTLYLTDNTPPAEIERARGLRLRARREVLPGRGHDQFRLRRDPLDRVYPVLAAMERHGVVLSLHGEVTDPGVDMFDRERVFVDTLLARIVRDFPGLRIVLEHITTREAARVRARARDADRARRSRRSICCGRAARCSSAALRPHFYCLPILKREAHRQALVAAATSGIRGSSSAPTRRRMRGTRRKRVRCAGCYSAIALALYAEAFEDAGALDRLAGFASRFGADFYGLPRNTGHVTLEQVPCAVPAEYPFGDDPVVPLRAGETLRWRVRRHESPKRCSVSQARRIRSPKPARPSLPADAQA